MGNQHGDLGSFYRLKTVLNNIEDLLSNPVNADIWKEVRENLHLALHETKNVRDGMSEPARSELLTFEGNFIKYLKMNSEEFQKIQDGFLKGLKHLNNSLISAEVSRVEWKRKAG